MDAAKYLVLFTRVSAFEDNSDGKCAFELALEKEDKTYVKIISLTVAPPFQIGVAVKLIEVKKIELLKNYLAKHGINVTHTYENYTLIDHALFTADLATIKVVLELSSAKIQNAVRGIAKLLALKRIDLIDYVKTTLKYNAKDQPGINYLDLCEHLAKFATGEAAEAALLAQQHFPSETVSKEWIMSATALGLVRIKNFTRETLYLASLCKTCSKMVHKQTQSSPCLTLQVYLQTKDQVQC